MNKSLQLYHRFTIILLSIVITYSCQDRVIEVVDKSPPNYSTITQINFSSHILPIFEGNCLTASCHNTNNAAGGLILNSWENIFRGSRSGAVIVSGNPSMSHLIQVINTDTSISPVSFPQMPLGRNPLQKEQVLFLKRWIDEGAKNDAGELPFTHLKNGRVFVTNQSSDLVAVIDIATNLLMRYVKIGSLMDGAILGAPHHVRVDKKGEFFYTTLINAQELWKYSAMTYEFIKKVSIQPSPADVILTTSGDTAIVTNFSTNPQVAALIETKNMKILATYTLPSFLRPFVTFSHGALLSHDGQWLYTSNQGSGNLTAINIRDGSMNLISLDTSGVFITLTQPYLADQSPDGRYIYVACYGTNDVRVIDRFVDTGRVTRIIPVGKRPLHVKVSADGKYVLSANQGSDDVTVIQTTDYSTTTIPDVGRQPHGVDFSPDGKYVYVTCENRTEAIPPHHPTIGSRGISFVSVIDFDVRRVIRRIEVGGFAAGISIADP
ncbi:MAG TPA: beta-propeller fold lactonase family protein [Bacteroidota bacterium]|nr:beta-propeller fold lactonase family protein [Bacteroidota bacterium]